MSKLVTAFQEETLDALAHRIYGAAAAGMLELLIELNPHTLADANLIEHMPVYLPPDRMQPATRTTVRLWD